MKKRQQDTGHAIAGRAFVAALITLTICLTSALTASAQGRSDDLTTVEHYYNKHQLGVRLGGWANLGDSPIDSVGVDENAFYIADIADANFYLEAYAGYRFGRALIGEFSVGIVSRGDLTFRDTFSRETFFGSLLVYPILAKAKIFPMGGISGKLHPYLMVGGGAYYARHDVQIVTSSGYVYRDFQEASKTKFSYVVGGGFDWPLASMLALDFNAQYMPIDFSEQFISIQDYSSVTITAGIKYLFATKTQKR